ncbi:NfnB1 [Desulforapulum autotrophicum HRM2]|uniref:NfnB1 n=1 Tax=Desulforapulum autotrophicum (strain ATCC 43914 / DSM 3382 / VKM B-1955 / HRM2) TaxID=177437 RepID=C0QL58_DESAH|nr:nitroreductase family protein [Desulforapulum autotrophicum]ACN14144.1 NfnB1 [Desulforapulum autotrophicum HRM2]
MEFHEVMKQRRSVNFFDPKKEVSEALLKEVIETAAMTPSGFNLQPWSLVALRKFGEKERLKKLAWNQPKVTEAPVVLIVLADRDAWKEGHPIVEQNFSEMVKSGAMKEEQRQWFADARTSLYGETPEKQQAFACKNTGFFAMSLMLAAKDLGLETHPMDGFDHDGVRKAFNIPDNFWIPLLLAVGYVGDDFKMAPPKWRRRAEDILVTFES